MACAGFWFLTTWLSASLFSKPLGLGPHEALGGLVVREQQLGERGRGALCLRPGGAMPEGIGLGAGKLQRIDQPGADFTNAVELELLGALVVAHDIERSGDAEQITDGISGQLFRAHSDAVLYLCSVVKGYAT